MKMNKFYKNPIEKLYRKKIGIGREFYLKGVATRPAVH